MTTAVPPVVNGLFLSRRQIARALANLPCFRTLMDETLRFLAAGSRQVHFPRKEHVFHKGERAENLHVVVDGQIKLIFSAVNGGERVINTVGRGEAFGLAAVCLNAPYPSDAVAKSDCYVLLIDRNILLEEASRNCALAMCLFRETARFKLNLVRDLENCAPRSSLQRVACFLLQHAPDSHDGTYDVRLAVTKREIAAKLDLTPETLSRMLYQLKRAEAIEVQGQLIRIRDSDLLASLRADQCSGGA